MKSLDEAIQHCEEVAEINKSIADNTETDNWMDIAQCEKCADEHRQLAEWLRELKERREQPEIIRCEECKYAHLTYDGECKHCNKWTDEFGIPIELFLDSDFYCGYAKRRTG